MFPTPTPPPPPPPPALPSSKPRYALDWDALPAAIVCEQQIYLEFASYMMEEYTYTLGKDEELELALSTQSKYLRYLLHHAQRKFGHIDAHKPFFVCLTAGVQSWLTSAEARIEREITTKCQLAGVPVFTSATAVHREHVVRIARAYLQHHNLMRGGTSLLKRLVVVLTWSAAGRPGEVATLCFDLCEWDDHYNCLGIWWHQPKVSKVKKVMLLACRDPIMCPFNAFADYFASGAYRDQIMMGEGAQWVLKGLAKNLDAGGTISTYISDMAIGSSNVSLGCVSERSCPRCATLS